MYLKGMGELKSKDVALCAVALLLLGIPSIGSVYPVPPAPVNYFPYVFLGYVVIGVFRAVAFKLRAPQAMQRIHEDLQGLHVPKDLASKKAAPLLKA